MVFPKSNHLFPKQTKLFPIPTKLFSKPDYLSFLYRAGLGRTNPDISCGLYVKRLNINSHDVFSCSNTVRVE